MPWFKVDDSFASHPKVLAIPRAKRKGVVGVWTLLGSWCAQHLTDGRVPGHMLTEYGGTSGDARILLEVGLWEPVDGGYQYHDWSDWQPTKAKVEEERSAARERMRKARERRSSPEQTQNFAGGSGEVAVTPTRPDPTRPISVPHVGLLASPSHSSTSPQSARSR